MANTLPRGIRNNNPGNLRRSGDKWQGLAPQQTDREFFVYIDAVYGIRALARTLITYQDKYGLNTVNGIISRWAPNTENDTGAYIDAVAEVSFSPAAPLDLHRYDHLKPLLLGIIRHENGVQPYTAAQVDKALALAGVEPPRKPLALTGTVRGGTASALGIAGTGVSETLQDAAAQMSQLTPYLETAKWAFLALTLAGVGYMLYRRWDDYRRLAR